MPDYLEWTVDEVLDQFDDLGLSQYSKALRTNDISGAVLPLLRDCHLKELGISKVGHRLIFLRFVKSLTNPSSVAKSAPAPRSADPPPRAADPAPARRIPPPSAAPPPDDYDIPSPSSAGSDWEKKRRQMLARKSQNDDSGGASPGSGRMISPEVVEASKPRQSKPPAKVAAKPPPRAQLESDDGYSTPPPPPPKRKPPPSRGPPPPADSGEDDRRACAYCGRKFASDRIDKHEEICARASAKKTKVFDAQKQRLQGTEAAAFARNPSRDPPKRESNYKREHENLVKALRAARKFTEYEKAKEEGRATGPPPALPKYEIEDDDRIQCPSCGRRFAAEAAQRHIAVCERMNGGGGGGGRSRPMPSRGKGRR